MKYLKLIFSCVLVLVLLLVSGCQQKATTKEAAKEMFLCSSLGEKATQVLVEAFEKKSGVKVKVDYLPSGSMETRLKFLTAKNYDCWLGGTAEEYNIAGQQKLLERYVAKNYYRVPVELRNKQGDWTSLYLNHIAFLSNKNKLKEQEMTAPQTWEELLEPELFKEIVIPDFSLGGASFGMLTSIWQLRGQEKALQYAVRLSRQQPEYTTSVAAAVDKVYKGEKTLTVIPISYALNLEEQHGHLEATVVKDANRNMLTGAAILKNGQNLKYSQMFLDYLLSDEGAEVLVKNGMEYIWHVCKNPYKDGREDLLGKVKVPVDDLNWTATSKNDIIRQWLEAK